MLSLALLLLLVRQQSSCAFVAPFSSLAGRSPFAQRQLHPNNSARHGRSFHIPISGTSDNSNEPDKSLDPNDDTNAAAISFDSVVNSRYACTRFNRHEEQTPSSTASVPNPDIVSKAQDILNVSLRAPSGFNVQPYRVILVSSPSSKQRLSKYAIGRNGDRVRDSDCTAVFLADRECGRDFPRFGKSIRERHDALVKEGKRSNPISNFMVRKIQVLVLLFSSGYPLPRFLAAPISFCVRMGVAVVSALTRRKVLVPSLSSAECWATKNTMLVAMTYILGCTSRGFATCPMEGFNAGGIRKALNIPRRYAIPLIVSTGTPHVQDKESDDVGISHAPPGTGMATARYPKEESLFQNEFGAAFT